MQTEKNKHPPAYVCIVWICARTCIHVFGRIFTYICMFVSRICIIYVDLPLHSVCKVALSDEDAPLEGATAAVFRCWSRHAWGVKKWIISADKSRNLEEAMLNFFSRQLEEADFPAISIVREKWYNIASLSQTEQTRIFFGIYSPSEGESFTLTRRKAPEPVWPLEWLRQRGRSKEKNQKPEGSRRRVILAWWCVRRGRKVRNVSKTEDCFFPPHYEMHGLHVATPGGVQSNA